MVRKIIVMQLMLLLFAVALTSTAQQTIPASGLYASQQFQPSDIKVYHDVVYSVRPNYKGIEYSQNATAKKRNIIIDTGLKEIPLRMDIAVPPNAKANSKQPLIIMIHGGAYHTGSKEERWKEALSYASAGYVAVTINYRLLPVATKRDSELWFMAIAHGTEDLQNAIRFLKANAKTYFIDTTRIATIGTSAGAILSILNGAQTGDVKTWKSDFPKISARVNAAIGTGGEFISKTKGINPMLHFGKNNVPMMFFHANPNDSGPAKATWDYNAVPLQRAALQAGAEFKLVAQPDHTHTVDMTMGKSPYWNTDLKPFLWEKLKMNNLLQQQNK